MKHHLSLLLLTAFIASAVGSAIFYWQLVSSAKAAQGPVLIKSELTNYEVKALNIAKAPSEKIK